MSTPMSEAAETYLAKAIESAGKLPDLAGVTAPAIKRVGVIGAGTMGSGIAMAFLNAGYDVQLYDSVPDRSEAAKQAAEARLARSVAKGRLGAEQASKRLAALCIASSYAALSEVDLALEAVSETMDAKKAVFKILDDTCQDKTILATNTSFLNVDSLANCVGRSEQVLGLHFFNPAHVMPLLEVVRGKSTSLETLAAGLEVARRLGKNPVISRVGPGFIANRMAAAYYREAQLLLLEVGSPALIDQALEKFGFPMGPFALMDLGGLDVFVDALTNTGGPDCTTNAVLLALFATGRHGQKSGLGFFRYDTLRNVPQSDPIVEALARKLASEAGVAPQARSEGEIAERCVLALVLEGLALLAEDIADRASDLDVVLVKGFGFPVSLGGPMRWAGRMGWDALIDKVAQLHQEAPDRWPAPGLIERWLTLRPEAKT